MKHPTERKGISLSRMISIRFAFSLANEQFGCRIKKGILLASGAESKHPKAVRCRAWLDYRSLTPSLTRHYNFSLDKLSGFLYSSARLKIFRPDGGICCELCAGWQFHFYGGIRHGAADNAPGLRPNGSR